jgi:hypothetical protein
MRYAKWQSFATGGEDNITAPNDTTGNAPGLASQARGFAES